MRKCTVISRTYESSKETPSGLKVGGWITNSPVEAYFHQFVTESSDGELAAMAIVEYYNGSVDTVPIGWVILQPEEPIAMLEASSCNDELKEFMQYCTDQIYKAFKGVSHES